MISLLDTRPSRQRHWWLADGGFPQRLASLLGAPLRTSGLPPRSWLELHAVFAPLPPLATPELPPSGGDPSYRYLIRLDQRGGHLSCWRRYPEGLGWQRRCGPMPVGQFIHRFSQRLTSPP